MDRPYLYMRCFVEAANLPAALEAAITMIARIAPIATVRSSRQERYWKIPEQFEVQLHIEPVEGDCAATYAALRDGLFNTVHDVDHDLVWSKREHGPGKDLPPAWAWAWLSVVLPEPD